MSEKLQYPLFILKGKSIYDYLYFRRNTLDGNERLLIYTDVICMAEVYNSDMKLSRRVIERGYI